MLHAISTLVLVILAAGVLLRRNRRVHVPLMLAAFAIDLGLVLYIEITRHAVERVAARPGPLLAFHATISAVALVLYVVQIVLGARLLRGREVSRRAHRRVAIAFCLLRLVNYVTSYMV